MKHIALIGFGVVGGGVDALLSGREDLSVRRILLRSPRPGAGDRAVYDFTEIENDPEIEIVAEAISGVHPTYEYACRALRAGKHYVTANKALIAAYGPELSAIAREHGVSLRCTAAVGGGIPWLFNLSRCRRVDRIDGIRGIFNGTTNFILSAMHARCADFSEMLSEAQRLGYAESDPSADLDGPDICRKLVISAAAAFDVLLREEDVPMFGIRTVSAADIANVQAMGRVCKLMAFAGRAGDGYSAFVEPTLLSCVEPEASVPANFNFIGYDAAAIGRQGFFGQGAGRFPTASNIVQDCLDLANAAPGFYSSDAVPVKVCNSGVTHSYYVRTDAPDAWLREHTAAVKDGFVLTVPISVEEMHRWGAKKRNENSNTFLAGIQ